MPRLDIWLVENGYFSSRQTAKRAIRDGLVTIDGSPAKPSSIVKGNENIKVQDNSLDHPVGYNKLRQLEFFLGNSLVSKDSLALDIGSSAGGFLCYLAENNVRAIGIEVSDSFIEQLNIIANQYPNVSIIIDDAFQIELPIICKEKELDLLLIDVTTDINGTLKLIKRFTPLLKTNCHLISAFKSKPESTVMHEVQKQVKNLGFTDIREVVLDNSLQEFHIIAIRG